jgi:phosphoribosylglycinamide formyltransferase 1
VILQPLRLGFLASGNGSSADAITAAIAAGELSAEARLLVSNKRDCAAFGWAAERGVATRHIPTVSDPEGADEVLCEALREAEVNLVVLSGYLRRLGPRTLAAYANRILNIHPGPLPRFGGEGMYGLRVHQAVVAAGVPASAMTVHLVDEEYDHGPPLAERAVPLTADDTAETLQARVKALEPEFFLDVLREISAGRLTLPA